MIKVDTYKYIKDLNLKEESQSGKYPAKWDFLDKLSGRFFTDQWKKRQNTSTKWNRRHCYEIKLEKEWMRDDLVILGELGYIPFSKTGAELLFQFCSTRHELGSINQPGLRKVAECFWGCTHDGSIDRQTDSQG